MSRIHDALKRAEQEKAGGVSPAVGGKDVPAFHSEPTSAADMAAQSVSSATDPLVTDPVAVKAPVEETLPRTAVDLHSWMNTCIPRTWSPDQKRLLFWNGNSHHQPGAEELRTLRARLYRIREKRPLKTVLVASAVPGEGKTFISANLSQVLARQHGRRILLIDCDLRKPGLHELLGASTDPGLTEYLGGKVDETAILQRSPNSNLYFISGGSPTANPAELLSNGRLKSLLDRVVPLFEWVVLDSPPVVPVADASQVATLCDGVLLVVLSGSTSFELTQRAVREFRHAPQILGVVLNKVESGQTYSSYYYTYGRGKHEK